MENYTTEEQFGTVPNIEKAIKTKFVKVALSERLPEKEGLYFTWVKNPNAELRKTEKEQREYNMSRSEFKNDEFNSFYDVTHWLEEVTDREEELIELLEKLVEYNTPIYTSHEHEYAPIVWKAKKLLQSLKQ